MSDTITLQRCLNCRRLRFPPMPTCPYCSSRLTGDEISAGRGVVYSWVGVDHPLDPQFAEEVPYVMALVQLAEGPRIVGRLDGAPGIGHSVIARFHRHESWTELRFVATGGS